MSRVLPILFNTDMVRAILDGRKTVTRRAVRWDQCQVYGMACVYGKWLEYYNPEDVPKELIDWYVKEIAKQPYHPGDILYVLETWDSMAGSIFGDLSADTVYFYKADGDFRPVGWRGNWHPSIHMPKEAARIWLKVTDVRVERLRNITEEQALAEGVPDDADYPISKVYCPRCHGEGLIGGYNPESLGFEEKECHDCDTAVKRFKNLWNSTIKNSDLDRYGWDANPWVWVIEFERCEKPEDRNG